jgi:hypothetical protein
MVGLFFSIAARTTRSFLDQVAHRRGLLEASAISRQSPG